MTHQALTKPPLTRSSAHVVLAAYGSEVGRPSKSFSPRVLHQFNSASLEATKVLESSWKDGGLTKDFRSSLSSFVDNGGIFDRLFEGQLFGKPGEYESNIPADVMKSYGAFYDNWNSVEGALSERGLGNTDAAIGELASLGLKFDASNPDASWERAEGQVVGLLNKQEESLIGQIEREYDGNLP